MYLFEINIIEEEGKKCFALPLGLHDTWNGLLVLRGLNLNQMLLWQFT